MVSVCFYFQVHQPYRIREYSVFEIGHNQDYFDHDKNRAVMRKVANKCYLPANAVILELLERHPEFRCTFSISGVALDQMEEYMPEVLESFKRLAATGRVEFLAETYYHSLAFLFDKEEFAAQVAMHSKRIEELFGKKPTAFRHTELIYNNELATHIEKMGFSAILAEGWDPILGWRSPNFVYKGKGTDSLRLLMKNYKLSDDIAFRFSNKDWKDFPLDAGKFTRWLNAANGNGDVINLFMDYETFGEHQWEDTGIFEFMRHLPNEVLKHPDNGFVTVSEAAQRFPIRDEMDVHHFVSWADLERDLSAWLSNNMQEGAIKELYRIGRAIKQTGDAELLKTWRKLTTSDHFYYMCVKYFSDGDVHKYFSPYETPYDAYIAYMNVLNDLALRAKVTLSQSPALSLSDSPGDHVMAFLPRTRG